MNRPVIGCIYCENCKMDKKILPNGLPKDLQDEFCQKAPMTGVWTKGFPP
jgi:hypothetical protein